jgi:hypothetical protein
VGAFKDYLSKYPKGGYAINAHFYQADCHYQAKRYAEVEEATNRRMADIFDAALDHDEADELARLSVGALATLKANVPG